MDIDQLVDAACERAGSTDFGPDTWQEGLGVLVGSLRDEAALNECVTSGCWLNGHFVMFEHMSDEPMMYSGGGRADIAKAEQVRSLVYRALFEMRALKHLQQARRAHMLRS